MSHSMPIIQIVVALGLLNVWILRFKRKTPYRGGVASSMVEEFAAYGLPSWFIYIIGSLKIGSAIALIAGLWYPVAILPAAVIIVILMLGALAMHFKVKDPLIKYFPAFVMLLMTSSLCALSIR